MTESLLNFWLEIVSAREELINKSMQKPDFKEMIERLEEYSQNLKENSQLGNSKLILAFVEMVRAMSWSSSQQDTNNIQIANLIGEVKNLKDITAAEAQTSARSSLTSNKLAWIAIVIALISSGFTAWNAFLANQSVKLTIQPRADYYLMPSSATSSDMYILGIENRGIKAIENINLSYSHVTIYRDGCTPHSIKTSCGGIGVTDVIFPPNASAPLLPSQSREVEILVGNPQESTFIHALKITVAYERKVDQQKTTTELIYFIDGYKIYTLDEARDIPWMSPYITTFRELSADTSLGGFKTYWK